MNYTDACTAGMIVREREPANLETPVDRLSSFLTPTELFYVRSHFSTPAPQREGYRLRVDGAVRRPLELSFDDLRGMPAESRTVLLECAGNSRVFLVPQAEGVQWELGAVGNAEWTGVPLAALLERASLEDEACEIVLEGADRGTPRQTPRPAGEITYARSLPRAKATSSETLIAYRMNGRDLSPEHGYPVRAIVPGHYAMASVKWLTRIHAVREPFCGYWQTSDYAYWDEVDGYPVRRPLGAMPVKSEIFRPGMYATLACGTQCVIAGAAWAGEFEVTEVSVSTNEGRSWAPARFIDPARLHSWRRWTFDWWTPDEPGRYTIRSRAQDNGGMMQPDRHNPRHGSYVVHHTLPIEVFITGHATSTEEHVQEGVAVE